MRGLAFVLLLWPAQDASRLIEQLNDDNITVRERAAERLIEMGAAALPLVEKAAASSDPEIRARAKTVLGEIRLAETRGRTLGPTGRVTIPEGKHDLKSIVDRVREQTGAELQIPSDRLEAPVTLGALERVPLLDFLDRLCRAHGGLALVPRPKGDAIELVAGEPWNGPTAYSGPFRVTLDRVRLERRDVSDGRFELGSILLAVAWQPNVHPIGGLFKSTGTDFSVLEIVGDDGKALEIDPEVRAPYNSMSGGPSGRRSVRHRTTFSPPAPGIRRLSRVRGHVDVFLPLKIETLIFENPREKKGSDRKAGAYTVKLTECRDSAEGIVATFHLEAPVETPTAEKRQQRVELRSRFDTESIQLVKPDGTTVAARSLVSSHASGQDADGTRTESHDQQVLFPGATEVKELRFPLLADYFERRVEFEFKDVELP